DLLVRLGYLPADDDEPAAERFDHAVWFVPTQVTVGAVAVAFSFGVALVWGNAVERLTGPLAATAVGAAVAMLANRTTGRRGRELVYLSFALGALTIAELGWASLDLIGPALAFQRTVA